MTNQLVFSCTLSLALGIAAGSARLPLWTAIIGGIFSFLVARTLFPAE